MIDTTGCGETASFFIFVIGMVGFSILSVGVWAAMHIRLTSTINRILSRYEGLTEEQQEILIRDLVERLNRGEVHNRRGVQHPRSGKRGDN